MPLRYCAGCGKRLKFKGKFAPWHVNCVTCRTYTGRYYGR